MAESTSSCNPPCANVQSSKIRKVERETSLFEHPAIVENVIPYLGLREMLVLGNCSKYLNGVCESDCTWKLLYMRRWGQQSARESSENAQIPQGWKPAYIARHKVQFALISKVLVEVEKGIRDDKLNSSSFHRGVEKLKSLGITYDDIYSIFLSEKLHVVFTMLGLYCAFFHFKIPDEHLKKAMAERGVIDKVVCARWSLPRTWNYGYYTSEEKFIRVYSLGTVVEKQMSILWLMRHAEHARYRDVVSNMSISYKIPEPFKCMACTEKEQLEKADLVD